MFYRSIVHSFSSPGQYDGYVITKIEYECRKAENISEQKNAEQNGTEQKNAEQNGTEQSTSEQDDSRKDDYPGSELLVTQKHLSTILETRVQEQENQVLVRMTMMKPAGAGRLQPAERENISEDKNALKAETNIVDKNALKPETNIADATPSKDCHFMPEQVYTFVAEVGDTNSIHQTKQPIVPGFMILEYVLERLDFLQIDGQIKSYGKCKIQFRHPLFAEEPFRLDREGKHFNGQGKELTYFTGDYTYESLSD